MKLRNKQAGMEIGIVHISKSANFKKGYWLYVQVGGVRMMVTRIGQKKARNSSVCCTNGTRQAGTMEGLNDETPNTPQSLRPH